MMSLRKMLKASVKRSTQFLTAGAGKNTLGRSFDTEPLPRTEEEAPTVEFQLGWWWQRREQRRIRRAAKAEQAQAEARGIQQWLEEKAPTATEEAAMLYFGPIGADETYAEKAEEMPDVTWAVPATHWGPGGKVLKEALASVFEPVEPKRFVSNHNPHDRHVHIGVGAVKSAIAVARQHEQMELYRKAIRDYGSRPVSPSPRRELEVLKLVDVEPEWTVGDMLEAHRVGATALERPLVATQGIVGATPIFAEVATYLYDPRHEMGPRQRSWHRQNRNQPTRTSRQKRRGKR